MIARKTLSTEEKDVLESHDNYGLSPTDVLEMGGRHRTIYRRHMRAKRLKRNVQERSKY